MWFEILPSYSVVVACLSFPAIIFHFSNKFVLGNAYRRRLYTLDDCHHYLRDSRLSGTDNPYKQVGLEGLPSVEETSG